MRKRFGFLTALAALLVVRAAPGARAADGSSFVDTGSSGDGLIGWHVYGDSGSNRGLGLDYATTDNHGWSLGLEKTYGDLYLFNYNFVNGGTLTGSNQTWFRLRGDTGQLTLGPGAGHAPNGWQQVAIGAGTSTAPLDGLGISAYGTHNQLNLYQANGGSNHTQLNLANKFQICTDQANNGGLDMYIYDNTLHNQALQITDSDLVKLNYGAQVGGTLTANGPAALNAGATIAGNLQHTGSQLGFYGAVPVTRPIVSGCTCDGSALRSLINALASQGLIIDQTSD